MSDHHHNPRADHDPALWRWSNQDRRWVRVTDYGPAWFRVGWDREQGGEVPGGQA